MKIWLEQLRNLIEYGLPCMEANSTVNLVPFGLDIMELWMHENHDFVVPVIYIHSIYMHLVFLGGTIYYPSVLIDSA